jgi:DNA-binding response OmpR family regulator
LRERLYGRLLDIDVFSDCAANGPDAVLKLEESRYSLVIADVGLPNQGIEQLVTRIAAMRKAERPIVLVLAGTPESARGLDVEIVQIVLRRPVDVNQIVDLVRSCVRNSSNGKHAGAGDGKADENGEQRQLIS